MKKIILFILVFILTIQITLAACCQTESGDNCYPDKNRCCGDPEVAYVGCEVANINEPVDRDDYYYYCPEENFYGCLECVCTDQETCEWVSSEICEDEGGNCFIQYIPDTEIPKNPTTENVCSTLCGEGQVWDQETEKCIYVKDIEEAICYNSDCITNKYCCEKDGSYDKDVIGIINKAVCSGDNDNDDVCNYYDNCIDTENTNQLDSDEDCPDEKSSFSEKCGDVCDLEEWCEGPYTFDKRSCCNDEYETLGITTGGGSFYGYFNNDCPKDAGKSLGCWDYCTGNYNGEEVIYEAGKCISGERIIKIFRIKEDGSKELIETKKEPCSGIPLIPFFTNFNLLISFLILFLFYFFRER